VGSLKDSARGSRGKSEGFSKRQSWEVGRIQQEAVVGSLKDSARGSRGKSEGFSKRQSWEV
jgi:hypothetical protein